MPLRQPPVCSPRSFEVYISEYTKVDAHRTPHVPETDLIGTTGFDKELAWKAVRPGCDYSTSEGCISEFPYLFAFFVSKKVLLSSYAAEEKHQPTMLITRFELSFFSCFCTGEGAGSHWTALREIRVILVGLHFGLLYGILTMTARLLTS